MLNSKTIQADNKKDASIELLRFIAMIMVVCCHVVPKFRDFCGLSESSDISRIATTLLSWWGGLGVMIFIIISAWLLVDKKMKFIRIANIAIQAFVIRIVFMILDLVYMCVLYGASYTIKEWFLYELNELLSPLWCDDWYVTVYIIFLLIMPFLNLILHNISPEKIRCGLIIFGFIPFLLNFQSAGLIFGGILYFPYFYILVGYLKLYKKDNFFSRKPVLKFLVVAAVYLGTKYIISILPQKGVLGVIGLFLPSTLGNDRGFSVIIGLMALFLFYSLNGKNICFPNVFRWLGKYAFLVYLVHPKLIKMYIIDTNPSEMFWNILKPYAIVDESWLYFLAVELIVVITTYIASVVIGIILDKCLIIPIRKFVYSKFNKQFEKVDLLYKSLT